MPTYDYECTKCGHVFDTFQNMSDAPLSECPECRHSALKRLIGGGVGVIFKGSGFYVTDSKGKSGAKSTASAGSSSESGSSNGTSGSGEGSSGNGSDGSSSSDSSGSADSSKSESKSSEGKSSESKSSDAAVGGKK